MKTLEDALAAIEEMKIAHEEEKAAILKKNKELLARERDAKNAADRAEEARQEAADEAALKTGDVETVKATLTKAHTAEMKKLQESFDAVNKKYQTETVDRAISDAIAKGGVMPQHVRAATLLLKDGLSWEKGEAFVDGVPFTDHLASKIVSDDLSPYIAAANNSGAGARGSVAAGPTVIKTLGDFMALAKTDPNAAKTVAVDPSLADIQKSLG